METTLAYKESQLQTTATAGFSWQMIILLSVLIYEGLGGLAGGSMLIAQPDGRLMDMPVEIMHGVFADFLIPGIILLAMGILSTVAFVNALRRKQSSLFLAAIALSGWVIWFATEIIILKELHWLHIMWGLPVLWGIVAAIPLIVSRTATRGTQKALLFCGIVSSLWYVLINIYVPFYDE